MANEEAKSKRSQRLYREQVAINRQVKIARGAGMSTKQPHRFAKHHACNCGDPKCHMCGNPRKFFNEPTIQELRFDQIVDDEDYE